MAWDANSAKTLQAFAGCYPLPGDCWAILAINHSRGKHRAYRHFPNWKEVVTIRGEDWPIAGEGQQLQEPTASPDEFWGLCMDCLSDTLAALGVEMPERSPLEEGRLTKGAFGIKQKEIEAEFKSGLAP